MAGILLKGIRTAAKTAKSPLADLAAYPILTEEVGYPPSPVATPSSPSKGGGTGTGAPLGQIVNKAVSEVLGWKIKPGDTKGFIGALNQSFTLTEVEGHIESKWTPRMQVKSGEKYTWYVRAIEGEWKGPAATSTFQGKARP